ncbi:UNVERIFIED_CONTAM: hypothetical protein FKN15_039896 [Acipenser sinensis]
MAQALSEEEFHRMQAQLLELRTQNYQLSDDLRKNTAGKTTLSPPEPFSSPFGLAQVSHSEIGNSMSMELNAFRQKTSTQEKDLTKALKALNKSKKAQIISELKEQLQTKQRDHEMALQSLKEQVACQSAESQEQAESILTENDALRTNLAALEQIQTTKTQEMNLLRDQNMALTVELQQHREEQENYLTQKDDLHSQIQEATRASGRLLEQLTELGQEKEKVQQELEEMCKTADKRKAMLDEMAIVTAQEKSRHKEEMSDVRLQHEKEVLSVRAKYERELRGLHEEKHRTEEEIRAQLREERARSRELEGLQQTVEELKLQIQSMEGTKGWFERRLQEAEETIEKNLLQKQEEIRNLHEVYTAQLLEKDGEIERAKQHMGEVEKERDDQVTTISNLKQEIKDTVDGQRILEKKGSSALKDLKRQLHLERKRADKLQERLQEILTNTKARTGLEEFVLSDISSPSHTQTGDSSSISSFSYREMMKEGTATQSSSKRPAELSDDEVGELFQRLAEVQQEKWMLEEKVKHLEVSCSSMADDICNKSAIIETYVMDSRIDVSAAAAGTHAGHVAHPERGILGTVLRDLVKPGDENLREMNKKLQNMLEEQLTKNMHLQKPSAFFIEPLSSSNPTAFHTAAQRFLYLTTELLKPAAFHTAAQRFLYLTTELLKPAAFHTAAQRFLYLTTELLKPAAFHTAAQRFLYLTTELLKPAAFHTAAQRFLYLTTELLKPAAFHTAAQRFLYLTTELLKPAAFHTAAQRFLYLTTELLKPAAFHTAAQRFLYRTTELLKPHCLPHCSPALSLSNH